MTILVAVNWAMGRIVPVDIIMHLHVLMVNSMNLLMINVVGFLSFVTKHKSVVFILHLPS